MNELAEKVAGALIRLVDQQQDQDHRELLPSLAGKGEALVQVLARLGHYADGLQGSARWLRGMRLCRIQADLYALLVQSGTAPVLPACGLDSEEMLALK